MGRAFPAPAPAPDRDAYLMNALGKQTRQPLKSLLLRVPATWSMTWTDGHSSTGGKPPARRI